MPRTNESGIDPVCLFHGKRWSEHHCLYCCLCFKTLTPEKCHVDAEGVRWDMCVDCGRSEEQLGGEIPYEEADRA